MKNDDNALCCPLIGPNGEDMTFLVGEVDLRTGRYIPPTDVTGCITLADLRLRRTGRGTGYVAPEINL